MTEQTKAATLLNQYPGTRERVTAMHEFIEWRSCLPIVELDGELLYVVGGDQLKDHDEICVEWINQFHPYLLGEVKHD